MHRSTCTVRKWSAAASANSSRLIAAMESIHARAQSFAMKRLFDLKSSGALRAFILPYLGQDDEKLAFPPADLVSRAAADAYPTTFSAMPVEWIEQLSRRGEQLTRALLKEHAPHLLSRRVWRSLSPPPAPRTRGRRAGQVLEDPAQERAANARIDVGCVQNVRQAPRAPPACRSSE